MLRAAHTLAALTLAGAGGLTGASVALGQGDGSGTDNPGLLRGALGVGCTLGTLCDFPRADLAPAASSLPVPAPVAAPIPLVAPVPPPAAPVQTPAAPPMTAPVVAGPFVPREAWDIGYGVTLRGAYVTSGGSERFEMQAVPQVTLSRSGEATDLDLAAAATLARPFPGEARVEGAEVSANMLYRLSPSAGLAFDANLGLSQDDPGGLDVTDANVARAPLEVSGAANAAYTQNLGALSATVSGGIARRWVGPTLLEDGAEIDNAGEAMTRIETALRLYYAFSPRWGGFVSGSVGRDAFDAADPDLGASRTGWDYALRGGIEANWSNTVTLEASAGYGWRVYDAATVSEAGSWLYGAALGFAPNATTQLRAGFDTVLAPGTGGSGASADYTLFAEASHMASSWLTLRAEAAATWSVPADGSASTRRYGAGAGADFLVGPHTTASLEYAYAVREDPAAGTRDEQRITGGITLRY